ncbi:DUF2515 family protein [Paenibacillus filicis]|uniref:DUF2515 family protein n=1 Tax=Paenibacillus filicis TaxID=669464 RepID=A0ABU9DUA5_9BACL
MNHGNSRGRQVWGRITSLPRWLSRHASRLGSRVLHWLSYRGAAESKVADGVAGKPIAGSSRETDDTMTSRPNGVGGETDDAMASEQFGEVVTGRPDSKEDKAVRLEPAALRALSARYSCELGAMQPETATAALTGRERSLLARIQAERDTLNRNNLTRTEAYLRFYRDHPELHWALLAHLVSRNGGWSMTDLCGEHVPFLLDRDQRAWVFAFLERANSLIFYDAYPQLLLYEASLRERRPLFHLLKELGVSAFMCPLWERFWEKRESSLLTIGLIVNEQHFIEERVIRHSAYREHVTGTFFFQLQSLLQLNQVLFPYPQDGGVSRLAGLALESFSSLNERIEIGKQLYAMLFAIPEVHRGAVSFAITRTHSGSRADYWPHMFTSSRQGPPPKRGQLREKLDGIRLQAGAARLYSPTLDAAWPDHPVAPPEPGDWFRDFSALDYLQDVEPPFLYDRTQAYGSGLKRLEMAVLAGDLFS